MRIICLSVFMFAFNFAVSAEKRNCLSLSINYQRLLSREGLDQNGFSFGMVSDMRWNDRWIFSYGGELGGHGLVDSSRRAIFARLSTAFGASHFFGAGKIGGQISAGPSIVFLKGTGGASISRKPSIGARLVPAIVWRPSYTGQFGYNLFVFTLETVYTRYFLRHGGFPTDSLSWGLLFGIEF